MIKPHSNILTLDDCWSQLVQDYENGRPDPLDITLFQFLKMIPKGWVTKPSEELTLQELEELKERYLFEVAINGGKPLRA
jgi:hypothetical protein